MPIKTVWLELNFEEAALEHVKESYAAETYALELCAREKAHLSVFLAAPLFKIPGVIPGAGLIPAWNAPAAEVNANRRAHAEEAQRRIAAAAKSAGVEADLHIVQEPYSTRRESLIVSARSSDVIILPRPGYYLSLDRSTVEAMLFKSGRPIILVPPDWARGAQLQKILVAWDGGGRAARAVGDAMPLLERAGEVEIVYVSGDASKTMPGAALADHLARHCKKVTATNLAAQHGGIGGILQAHAATAGASLLVMGAYAHRRMLERVLGGVTSDMLSDAEFPVFLSY
jgi:nucleotide-binding universal stress UspA family protein